MAERWHVRRLQHRQHDGTARRRRRLEQVGRHEAARVPRGAVDDGGDDDVAREEAEARLQGVWAEMSEVSEGAMSEVSISY